MGGLRRLLPCGLLLVTLDCSPVSPAQTVPGGETIASYVGKVRTILSSLVSSPAKFVILETSSGLWTEQKCTQARIEIESFMSSSSLPYEWHSSCASLDVECGNNSSRRTRVFYFGLYRKN